MALLAAMQIDMQIDVVVGVKMYLVGMNRTKMGGCVTMTVNHLLCREWGLPCKLQVATRSAPATQQASSAIGKPIISYCSTIACAMKSLG